MTHLIDSGSQITSLRFRSSNHDCRRSSQGYKGITRTEAPVAMIGLLAFAAVTVASCTVEQAQYVQRHNPGVTAYFRPIDSGLDWPSRIALAVHYAGSGKTFWWLPWNGGSNALQNVASTEDVTVEGWQPPSPDGGPRPYGNRQYIGTDATYKLINHVPKRGEAAPAHMLFPDSGGSRDTAFLNRQFFDLVGCRKRGT